MDFLGYVRPDGKVGIRNKVLIMSVDECMAGVAEKIGAAIEDAVVVTNHYTCMLAGNEEILHNLIGLALNPNIAAVLVLSMGCGSIDPVLVQEPVAKTGKPAEVLVCLEKKGSRETIKEGIAIAQKLRAYADTIEREPVDVSALVVAVKCGGSDTSSGLASNPTVGKACDLLVEAGGTAIAGELIELIGCEEILEERIEDPKVFKKLQGLIEEEQNRWNIPGVEVETMSIGNSLGGLTTIEEKSLGAMHKTGSKPIIDVLQISGKGVERPGEPGFYLSEASHLCGASAVQFASLGAHMILWTSGGSGFNHTIIPVIRVSGNKDLINEDTDLDVTGIMEGTSSVDSMGEKLFDEIIQVASGKKTAVEELGHATVTFYQKDVRLEHMLRSCNR